MPLIRVLGILLLTVTLLCAFEQTPVFQTSTREVLLDVVVTTASGRPIQGLNKKNFTVLENGVPQRITSFLSPQPHSDPSSQPGGTFVPGRTIILLDLLNLQFGDLAYARYSIREFLKRHPHPMQPTALMTIGSQGLVMNQNFTTDGHSLESALSLIPATPTRQADGRVDAATAVEHANTALASLEQIARAAVGYGFRLNVVWITSAFRGVAGALDPRQNVTVGLRRLSNLLLESRMSLYTIDPAGVLQESPVRGPNYNRAPSESEESATGRSNNATLSTMSDNRLAADLLLRTMTRTMGGLSYFNRNDVDQALHQAIADGSSAYTLSYAPVNQTLDGSYRKIDVRMDQAGVKARTRQGYYAAPDELTSDSATRDVQLRNALGSPLPYAGEQIACTGRFDVKTNRLEGQIAIHERKAITGQDSWIVLIASLSKENTILDSRSWLVSAKEWAHAETALVPLDQPVPQGASRLRAVVADPSATRIGTCELALPRHP